MRLVVIQDIPHHALDLFGAPIYDTPSAYGWFRRFEIPGVVVSAGHRVGAGPHVFARIARGRRKMNWP